MKPTNQTSTRWHHLLALGTAFLLAFTTGQDATADSNPPPARLVGITAAPIKGMPTISAADAAAWETGLGLRPLAGDIDGMPVTGPGSGPVTPQLASRGASQTRLGLPKLLKNFGDRLMVKNDGGGVSIVADVTPIAEIAGTMRAGVVVTTWMTKAADVDGIASRPNNSAWRGPDVPRAWKTRKLQDDFRGLFKATKLSRGHIRPSAEAKRSHSDQMATFRIYDNAFPQAEFSNAGLYRDAEKAFQRLAVEGDYEIYNYAGPVWSPVTYTDVDGKPVTVKSEIILHKGKKAPKPAGFFRVGIIVPNKDASGRALSLGEALQFARPVSIIAPNIQDPYLMVSGIKPFIKTAGEVQDAVGIELFTHLANGPNAAAIRQALLAHRDSGDGLPGELTLPPWKVMLLKTLTRMSGRIGAMATRSLQALPHQPEERTAIAPKRGKVHGAPEVGVSRRGGSKPAHPGMRQPRAAAPRVRHR